MSIKSGKSIKEPTLFRPPKTAIPLAERVRPMTLEDVIGQEHLLGKNGVISEMLKTGSLAPMILWGPPGTGRKSASPLQPPLGGSVGFQRRRGPPLALSPLAGSEAGLCPSYAAPDKRSRGQSLSFIRAPVSTLGFRTPNPLTLNPDPLRKGPDHTPGARGTAHPR